MKTSYICASNIESLATPIYEAFEMWAEGTEELNFLF